MIGLDDYLIEQKVYFEKLIKLAPKNIMIITFLYNSDAENVFYMNACFDSFSLIRFYDEIKDKNIPITAFIPKCDKNAISQMIYLSENGVFYDKNKTMIIKYLYLKMKKSTIKRKD